MEYDYGRNNSDVSLYPTKHGNISFILIQDCYYKIIGMRTLSMLNLMINKT